MKEFTARAFNSFKNYPEEGVVVKTSGDSRLKNEASFYDEAKKERLDNFFANKLLFTEVENEPYALTLELYDYQDLGFLMIEDKDFKKEQWEKIRDRIVFILDRFQTKSVPGKVISFRQDRVKMYLEKTKHYYDVLIKDFPVFKYFEELGVILNGRNLFSFASLWPTIQKVVQENIIDKDVDHCFIHGDLCFSNILCSDKNHIIKLIDPRGSFGKSLVHGDSLYDVAKLMHSYEGGYEYIINDAYKIDYGLNKDDCFYVDFKFINDNKNKIQKIFEELEIFRDPCARLIQGLIFIGMCSRHYDNQERQIIMYCTGLQILEDVLKNCFHENLC